MCTRKFDGHYPRCSRITSLFPSIFQNTARTSAPPILIKKFKFTSALTYYNLFHSHFDPFAYIYQITIRLCQAQLFYFTKLHKSRYLSADSPRQFSAHTITSTTLLHLAFSQHTCIFYLFISTRNDVPQFQTNHSLQLERCPLRRTVG